MSEHTSGPEGRESYDPFSQEGAAAGSGRPTGDGVGSAAPDSGAHGASALPPDGGHDAAAEDPYGWSPATGPEGGHASTGGTDPWRPDAPDQPAAHPPYVPYGGSTPYGRPQAPGYPAQASGYPQQPPGYADPSPYGQPPTPPYQQPPAWDQGAPAAGYAPPGYGQAGPDRTGYDVSAYPGVSYPTYAPAASDHPQATAALVTGIIGLVTSFTGIGGLVGIAGILLGTKVRNDIDADPARYTGRGKATAGLVTGILGLLGTVLFVVFFLALRAVVG